MANKQTSMRAKKQQKAKTRQKEVLRKKNPATQKVKPTDAQLKYEISKRGLVATAKKYRRALDKGDTSNGPSHNDISQGFITFIDIMTPIHSALEIADILVKEGKITFSDEERAQINAFDEQIVKANEDINAIGEFMKEGLEFHDFADLFVHYAELSANMATDTAPLLFRQILKPYGVMISEYAREHKITGEVDMAYAMRMHEQRMKTIYPLYRTILDDSPLDVPEEGDDGGIPPEFIPAGEISDAELVGDVVVDELRDVSQGDK